MKPLKQMNNDSIHPEPTFESAIIEHLCSHGWVQGIDDDFSKDLAFNKFAVLDFIKESQPKEWVKLASYYKDETEDKFIQRLFKELDLRGMLDVLRPGISDSGCK